MKKRLLRLVSVLCMLALAAGVLPCLAAAEGTAESRVILVEWRDENNADGLRPDSVTATLSGGQSVTLTAENGWTAEIGGLAPGEYTWTASAVEGYTATVDQGDITAVTYHHSVKKTEVTTSVSWSDQDNVNGLRPGSVQVRLLADGQPYASAVTLGAGNSWSSTWANLPRNRKGTEEAVTYTVEAVEVPANYALSQSGNDLTFTLETGTLVIENSISGLPEGTETDGLSMTVTGPDHRMPVTFTYGQLNGGRYTLTGLVTGAYMVQVKGAEDLAPGYYINAGSSTTQDAVQVKAGETATMHLRCVFTDVQPDPSENEAPTSGYGTLSFEILGPDSRMPMTVTYAQFTGGRYELTDLTPGEYVVIERNAGTLVASYVLQSDSITGVSIEVAADGTATASLFNHYGPAPTAEPNAETVEVPVSKIWDDFNNRDGNRPASVTVHLYADGAEVDSHELTDAEGWVYTFTELPRFQADGVTEIVYSVNEDPVTWYVPVVNGYTITNRYEPEVTSVSVRKVWLDNNNEAGRRPTSIAMTLSNGQIVVLNEANGWAATVSDLPTMVNGQPVQYAWKEQQAIGYVQSGVVQDGSTMIFTNTLWTRPELEEGETAPKVAGDVWYVFEEYETPLGVEVMINHVGDCFD